MNGSPVASVRATIAARRTSISRCTARSRARHAQGLQGNRSFYSNPEVDKLIREAAAVSDTAKRVELYQTAQKKVLDDSVYAYLYQKSYSLPMRDSVKGYVFNPMLEQVFNLGSMSK